MVAMTHINLHSSKNPSPTFFLVSAICSDDRDETIWISHGMI